MSEWLHENPALLVAALQGQVNAVRAVGRAIFASPPDPVRVADARTSVADWQGLVALRHAEAEAER